MPGRVNHRAERFQILCRNGRPGTPRASVITDDQCSKLREHDKQIAQVSLVGGIS